MVDRRRPCSARQPACRPGSGRGLPPCRSRALSEHPAANGHHPLGALSSSARPWRLTVASLRKASPSPRRGTASASGCAPRQTSRCRSSPCRTGSRWSPDGRSPRLTGASSVAWQSPGLRSARLYRHTWANPRPADPVTAFTLTTTMHPGAPFIAGVTAEE